MLFFLWCSVVDCALIQSKKHSPFGRMEQYQQLLDIWFSPRQLKQFCSKLRWQTSLSSWSTLSVQCDPRSAYATCVKRTPDQHWTDLQCLNNRYWSRLNPYFVITDFFQNPWIIFQNHPQRYTWSETFHDNLTLPKSTEKCRLERDLNSHLRDTGLLLYLVSYWVHRDWRRVLSF